MNTTSSPTAPTTDAATPPIPDVRPQFEQAMAQVATLLQNVTSEQRQLPTPCAEMDVEALVWHLQGVIRRVAAVLSGQPFHTAPSQVRSDDWVGDWQVGCEQARAVLADDACLTRECLVPWGACPGAAALGMYVGEVTVHSWDLAMATGQLDRLAPELALGSLAGYHAALPAEPRGGPIPFGPVVPVAEDADPYQRLVAWTGRDPRWGR